MTTEQRNNLLKLADFLAALPDDYEHFDMQYYNQRSYAPEYATCGTVACAAGHGPMAGIHAEKGEDWGDYVTRVFGLSLTSRAFGWCFSMGWHAHDNTPHGAAQRIYYYLANGVPATSHYDTTIYADAKRPEDL